MSVATPSFTETLRFADLRDESENILALISVATVSSPRPPGLAPPAFLRSARFCARSAAGHRFE